MIFPLVLSLQEMNNRLPKIIINCISGSLLLYTIENKGFTISFSMSYMIFLWLQVCAPTGAGKTNIAMISILHEVNSLLLYIYLFF